MIEPPSRQLLSTLTELDLCSPRDVRRCRRRVRRLALDVPAFDSVWIDALLQLRRLTPFQARLLESPRPERLNVGPCVLLDALGHGRIARTYLARRRAGRERCVVKIFEGPPEWLGWALPRVQETVERLENFAHPSVVAPHACLREGNQLVTVSRLVPGLTLEELLIRRGRFPVPVMIALAGQLIDALAALEERGGLHGDIRPRNVRLTDGGVAALVDAGIAPAVQPELTVHAALPPDRYDGTAPERIGTAAEPTTASDAYALGCLMWHLLAGRPPFPTGDLLAKLAAHQTREIDDVRRWAPDTPPDLAAAIRAFTARDPHCRPQTFGEVRERWGATHRRSRRRLARFRAEFDSSAPRAAATPTAAPARWPLLIALLFMLSGAAFLLLDHGARGQLLRIVGRAEATAGDWLGRENSASDEAVPTTPALLPLPAPDARGVIELSTDGPYEAADIAAVGPLLLRGTGGARPEIVVTDKPLRFWAERLTLENVHFRADHTAAAVPPTALVEAQAQSLRIRRCRFESLTVEQAADATPRAAVAWRPIERDDKSGRSVEVRDTAFLGAGSALRLESPPDRLIVENVLKLHAGELLSLAQAPAAGRELRITLDRVTLRQASSLMTLSLVDQNASAQAAELGPTMIDANNCVFDLAGRPMALFRVTGPHRDRWPALIELIGEGTLAGPGVIVAVRQDSADGSLTPLGVGPVLLEGVSTSPYEFAGPLSPDPTRSAIRSYRAAHRSDDPPGIDPAAFGR